MVVKIEDIEICLLVDRKDCNHDDVVRFQQCVNCFQCNSDKCHVVFVKLAEKKNNTTPLFIVYVLYNTSGSAQLVR